MVSLCCRVPSKSSFALAAVVLLSSLSDVVVAEVSGECALGIQLPDDFDGSNWPPLYRLSSPDPTEPMLLNEDGVVDPSVLAMAGITYKFIDPTGYDYPNATSEIPWFPPTDGNNDIELLEMRDDQDYQYADIIAVTAFIPRFWDEHYHDASTIRYILDGSGYFDYRDLNDEWVRMYVTAGDFLEWPTGIDHRFSVDSEDSYIQAMRLFKGSGSPVWTSVPRSGPDAAVPGENAARNDYVSTYLCDIDPDIVLGDDDATVDSNSTTTTSTAAPDVDDHDSHDDHDDHDDHDHDAPNDADSGAGNTSIGSLLSFSFIVVVGIMSTTIL